jgi:hypothetical protein
VIPLLVIATAGALWYFLATYQRLDWRWTWQSAAIGGPVFLLWLALAAGLRAHWTGWRMRPHSTVEGAWGKLCMPT